MNRILTLVLWLLLSSSPALAGFVQVPGSGTTGGAQADWAYNATGGNTITMHPTTSIPSGTLMIVRLANGNGGSTSTGFTCTDTKGNSWTAEPVSSEVAAGVQTLYTVANATFTVGDSVTCPETSGPAGGIFGMLEAWSGQNATPIDTVANTGGGGSPVSTLTVGPTGAITCPGGGSNCSLAICTMLWGRYNSGNMTFDSNYVREGGPATATYLAAQYRLLSSTTAAQSCTTSTTSSDRAVAQLVIFKAAVGGAAAPPARTLIGVGQ